MYMRGLWKILHTTKKRLKKKLRFWEVFCVNDFSALSFIVCVLTYWIIKKYNRRINEWANKILLNHKHKEKEEIIFVKERNMIT